MSKNSRGNEMTNNFSGKPPKSPKQNWNVKAHNQKVKTKDGVVNKWVGSTQAKRKVPSAFGK